MVDVLLFAQLQEEVGTDKLTLPLTGSTIKELKEKLRAEYGLHQVNESMVAVNEAYALDEDHIQEGDVVAIIPPVSGG